MSQPMKPSPPPRMGNISGRQHATDISLQFQNRLKQYQTFTPQSGQYETGAGSGGIDALPPAAAAPSSSSRKGRNAGSSAMNKLLYGGERSFYRGETASGRQQSNTVAPRISLDQMLAVADENILNATGSSASPTTNQAGIVGIIAELTSTRVDTINAVDDSEKFAASMSHRIVSDPLYEDAAFLIWLKENPNASDVVVRAEMARRNKERLDAERVARMKNLQQWNKELEHLQREEELTRMNQRKEEDTVDFIAGQLDKLQQQPLAPRPPPRGVKIQIDEQKEKQRLAWSIFSGGDGSPSSLKQNYPLQRVLETTEDARMHEWVQQSWADNTDRHERAALRIQCCFRAFVAKERVEACRYARHEELQQIMKNEEQAMLAWEVAVATQQAETASATAVDRTFKAVQVFSQHMKSNIVYRRKAMERARAARSEVEEYAATRIQTIFRGYLAKRYVRELKNPQMAVDREAHTHFQAAVKIQAIARRFLVKMEMEQKLKLVLMLQRLTRQHTAMVRLTRLRKLARQKEHEALRSFAASQIQRNYRAVLARRRAVLRRRLLESVPQIRELQTIGRAHIGRKSVASLRKAKLDRAATRIQCMCRCSKARVSIGEKKAAVERQAVLEKENHAAVQIQQHMKGFAARRRLLRFRRETASQRCIAACWQGHLGRVDARGVRKERQEEVLLSRQTDAATMVQSTFRGYTSRRRQSVQRDAAELIQATVRRVIARYEVDEANYSNMGDEEAAMRIDAADCIGRFYVAFIRWPALSRYIRRSAVVLSRFLRRVPAYKAMRSRQQIVEKSIDNSIEHSAAQIIQQAVRQRQARVKVRAKLHERAESYNELRLNEASKAITRFIRMAVAKKQVTRLRVAKGLPPTYQRPVSSGSRQQSTSRTTSSESAAAAEN